MKIRGKILFLAGVLTALGAGWAGFPHIIYQSRPQPVDFSHKVHADKAGSKCEDCHVFREDGSFAGIPPLAQCAGCHAAPMGTTAAEKNFIEQYVTPNREPQWLAYARQPENVWFSHAIAPEARQAAVRALPRRAGKYGKAAALPAGPDQRLFARHLGSQGPSRNDHGRLCRLPSRAEARTQLPGLPQMTTRRDILKFAGGSAVGVLFTPAPWRLITDTALWSENWPGIPRPARGEIRAKLTNCGLCPAGCAVRARCVGEQPVALAGAHGGLCPFGLTGHHLPYHPERLQAGTGERSGRRRGGCNREMHAGRAGSGARPSSRPHGILDLPESNGSTGQRRLHRSEWAGSRGEPGVRRRRS